MSAKLLGDLGVTKLNVYQDRPGPDGIHAGCAHVHGLTDEAYFGISGKGAIELHDLEQGYRKIEITKGVYVQFPPWTLHRSVSVDELEVVALMGNQGLPERGDARIFFSEEIDLDPQLYAQQSSLEEATISSALLRRDVSTKAYMELMDLWERDRPAYETRLHQFFNSHRQAIKSNPVLASYLTGVSSVDGTNIQSVGRWQDTNKHEKFGMCGRLRQVDGLEVS